ncbi:MAG: hypothetical protein IJT96_11965 [Lachnospiraceae bacterium]|nr:hypothetical protein [Lachnospiraceae bacterium]
MPDTLVTTIDYMPVGDISVLALCFLILILLPAIGFMYLLHSNPFDLATGAVSGDSLSFAVRDCYKTHG